MDERNRIVTTPCYMNDVGPWTVFQGAKRVGEGVPRMVRPAVPRSRECAAATAAH